MIDSATVNLPWSGPFLPADRVGKVGPTGVVLWVAESAMIPEGSWGEKLTLRTSESGKLSVSGNPAKFLQAHNLFGSDDLRALVVAATCRALAMIQLDLRKHPEFAELDLTPCPADLTAWRLGDFTISRVDINSMFRVGSTADVRSWLLAASEASRVKWKNKVYMPGTLYFGHSAKGKRAKDESWKLYCKRDELDAHKLPELPHRQDLIDYAEGMLRAELTLRTRALKKMGLHFGHQWTDETAVTLFAARWETLEMSDNATVPVDVVRALPRHLQAAYLAWKAGMDPAQLSKKTTLYRHRQALIERIGVDILVPAPVSNVIPLRRVLTLTPATIPDWARGTSLLFDSRTALAA